MRLMLECFLLVEEGGGMIPTKNISYYRMGKKRKWSCKIKPLTFPAIPGRRDCMKGQLAENARCCNQWLVKVFSSHLRGQGCEDGHGDRPVPGSQSTSDGRVEDTTSPIR